MSQSYPHLELHREKPVNPKRSKEPPRTKPPKDVFKHGRKLQKKLSSAKEHTLSDVGGFDERRLFRFTVKKGTSLDYFDLRKLSLDMAFVSQEGNSVVVGFASEAALAVFESRLASLATDGEVTNKNVFYALKSVDGWSAEDRKGWTLKKQGLSTTDKVLLDVELWPLEDNGPEREREWRAFEQWLVDHDIQSKDQIKQPGLTLYRVRCEPAVVERLLHHRDVRCVDLPPSFGLERSAILRISGNFHPSPIPVAMLPGSWSSTVDWRPVTHCWMKRLVMLKVSCPVRGRPMKMAMAPMLPVWPSMAILNKV